ncbi:MAG: hypothetical protein V4591_01155 [Bdellovibrionota bacterium]
MNNLLKIFKLVCGLVFCLFSCRCFSVSMQSNFISVSSHNSHNEQEGLQQNLRKVDAQCQEIFSFYANSNRDEPKIVTKKANMVFLFSEENKLEPLGSFLPPESKDLLHMESSVAEGKLLFGFKNKARESVALIQDSSGVVYSVTRNSRQHYSIQTLGVLHDKG